MSARSRPSASIKLPAGMWKEWRGGERREAEKRGERGGEKEEGKKRRGKRGVEWGIFFWH